MKNKYVDFSDEDYLTTRRRQKPFRQGPGVSPTFDEDTCQRVSDELLADCERMAELGRLAEFKLFSWCK